MISRFLSTWSKNANKARRSKGQGLAEYGLALGLIAVVCIAATSSLGTGVSGLLEKIAGATAGAAVCSYFDDGSTIGCNQSGSCPSGQSCTIFIGAGPAYCACD